jgi:hypothetical protein
VQFSRRFRSGFVLLGLLLITSMVFGQIRSGTISGTVKDPTGAVVANADVIVTEQETNVATATKTNSSGQYTVPYLPAGTYTVSVTVPGFLNYRQTGIPLATAQSIRVDVELQVGGVEQAIEVTADVAQIQTDSSTVQGAMQSEMISNIPNISQNPLFYAMLQAGVVPRNAASDSTSLNSFGIGVEGRRQWSALGVNGGRAFTNDIQLDGLPVMGGGYNEASVVPNTEGLMEVRVITNNFSAQYGHGQSVIAMSTKSGTNDFHGQATYRLRHDALNANTASNNANGIIKPDFRVDEIGGALGGPIVRDKLFFFSSYHYMHHDRESTSLLTVPTPLERVGNFSQTKINVGGAALPAMIFDPWNVTQIGPDQYERAPIPDAIIPNPDPHALYMYSFYPDPNRTPDDAWNTNNYTSTNTQTVRRHSLNNRVDYRVGNHSIYGSGGISYAKILTPRPFGTKGFNDMAAETSDKNPYGQIGDTIVISPTVVADVRYGFNRINTKTINGNPSGFTQYDEFGIPKNVQSLMLKYGAAPVVRPNDLNSNSGNGGGNNWAVLSDGRFGYKTEYQSNHNITGSVTKIRGTWTHKAGVEYRNLLSNYSDPEQAAAQIASSWHQVGGNFNFQYLTAAGGVHEAVRNNQQRGVNGAGLLLGAGLWWVRPGANVNPAFSQKYFAVYSQNDWRATDKLTINLGLRWDLQPGPTERFDRMSAWDLEAMNSFGTLGRIAFAGKDGYSRNLWDTQYNNWGPRIGAAYQLDPSTVFRGGFGITYLPSNTGYFSGPTDYGSANFSSGVNQIPYGLNPNGVPVGRFSDPAPLALAVGGNERAPQVYGVGEARFDRHFKNGRVMQWNFFIEKRFSSTWFASVGYSASHGDNLTNRSFPIQNLQSISPATLAEWRETYLATGSNPANQQVLNPFQPATGDLLPFSGVLGQRTIALQNTLYPYPLLVGSAAAINQSRATSDYQSLQLRVNHAFANGFMFDAHYTWSKEIDNTDNVEDNQGFNAGGTFGNPDILNLRNNRHLGFSDIPHRFVATFLYDLPFGAGKAVELQNSVLKAIASGWQTGGSVILQSGMPFAISGASGGSVNGRPIRLDGVDIELPKELQRWYDGSTVVTLPSGRTIRPGKNTFLKYNPDAFMGMTAIDASGRAVQDVFWWGTAAPTYNDMRGPGRFNIDLSVRREFAITEQVRLEFAADATNVLNHTQLSGNYSGGLGNTNIGTTGGQSSNFGTISLNTFDPRNVVLNLRLRF